MTPALLISVPVLPPVISAICKDIGHDGFQVTKYTNAAGDIGGYTGYTSESGGASNYYYDAKGQRIDALSAVETLWTHDGYRARNNRVNAFNEQLKDFPHKEMYSCEA